LDPSRLAQQGDRGRPPLADLYFTPSFGATDDTHTDRLARGTPEPRSPGRELDERSACVSTRAPPERAAYRRNGVDTARLCCGLLSLSRVRRKGCCVRQGTSNG